MRNTGKIAYLFTLNFALSISCQASPQQAKSSEQSLDLTVGVENWAGVSRTMLTSAEKAAGNVFRRVGIEVTWREISAASPPTAGAGATLLLRISRSKDFGYPEPSLGFNWPRGPNDVRAVVFIDRVELLARRSNARLDAGAVLGCAMAHELGHLLLGSEHSSEGIMRPAWNSKDVRSAAREELRFTARQRKALREELYRQTSHARSAQFR